jgi:hypothetical protein
MDILYVRMFLHDCTLIDASQPLLEVNRRHPWDFALFLGKIPLQSDVEIQKYHGCLFF